MEKPNKIERLKTEISPAEFEKHFASLDWQAPSEAARFYLKSFGIYNIKIRPEAWMIRLRIDGGFLSPDQLLTIAQLSLEYDAFPLVTARSPMELHHIDPKDVYSLWQKLREAGIETRQTLTDNFRAIMTDPLDDIAPDSHVTCAPLIEEIHKQIIGATEWMGTIPRKFNTVLIGREAPSFNPWGNDLLFALAKKENQWGFNLYLGGKNNVVAQDIDVFCPPEEVPEYFMAIAHLYHQHGLRGSRSKTRLYHLIETVGIEQVRQWLEASLPSSLQSAGTLRMQSSTQNTDYHLPIQRFGHHGELKTQELIRIAQEAQKNSLQIRLTPHQQLWLFDPKKIHSLLISHFSLLTPKITTCAGARYCPLSLWDIKTDTKNLPLERLSQHGISVGFSGCLKGCGRHYHSDIGLIGLRTNLYGETERAVRFFIGATQTPDPTPGRMIYYSVPERKLHELLNVVVDDFERSGFETFEVFSGRVLNRYSEEMLQVWYLVRQLYPLDEGMWGVLVSGEEEKLWSLFSSLSNFPAHDERHEVIRELTHRLWDRG